MAKKDKPEQTQSTGAGRRQCQHPQRRARQQRAAARRAADLVAYRAGKPTAAGYDPDDIKRAVEAAEADLANLQAKGITV